jgi:hypothetical protein
LTTGADCNHQGMRKHAPPDVVPAGRTEMPAPPIAKPQVLTGDTFFNAVSSRAAGERRGICLGVCALCSS